ncbi:MAG TPA: hypothetical protein VJ804_09075, partial [Acidimicrobiales bacterium]|nr:hypothetical protein [Acidimicrobiales bacterium]
PLAVVGLVRRPTGVAGYVAGVAVAALPVVWAFQYLGGALPQWGGRYTLPSCLLLVVVGVAALPDLERVTRALLVGLAALVTASGMAWTADRGHEVADWFEEVGTRPEDVLIARNGFLVREGGAAGADRRWLVAVGEEDLRAAVQLVADAGLRTFATVDEDPTAPPGLGDARLTGTSRAPFLGEDLYLHAYALDQRGSANMRSSVTAPR